MGEEKNIRANAQALDDEELNEVVGGFKRPYASELSYDPSKVKTTVENTVYQPAKSDAAVINTTASPTKKVTKSGAVEIKVTKGTGANPQGEFI